jgi:hypothetical protein
VQIAGPANLVQFALQFDDAVADQTAVDFQLTFTRTAEEAEAAALPFQVCPRPDKA